MLDPPPTASPWRHAKNPPRNQLKAWTWTIWRLGSSRVRWMFLDAMNPKPMVWWRMRAATKSVPSN